MRKIEKVLEQRGVVADVDYEVIAEDIKAIIISKRNIEIEKNKKLKNDFINSTGLCAETHSNQYYVGEVIINHYNMILEVL